MENINQAISFIQISDLHLGLKFDNASFSVSKGDERRRELVETLYRVIDYIAQNQIDFLFITGDAFESKYISTALLADINYNFAKISNCQIVMISGNHDPLSNGKIYDAIKWQQNVHIIRDEFETLLFEDKKCTVTGSVFQNEVKAALDFTKLKAGKVGYHNILLLHGNVFSDDNYCYIDKQKLLALDYSYVGLGHIHKAQFIAPHIAYAGSLEPLDFGESGQHGFVLGKLGATVQFEFVPFCKRRFIRLQVEIDATDVITSIIEKIKVATAGLSEDFIRISLIGYRRYDLTLDPVELASALNLYYFEIDDQTKPDIDIAQVVNANQAGFIGEFANCFTAEELADESFQTAYRQGVTMLFEEQAHYED